MKRIKHLLLFVGTALFLAACGTGGNGGDNGGGQDGTLRFALNGVPSAAVEVLSGSDTVFAETVEDGDSTTLAAGSYTVRAGAVSGFNAPAAENVTVVAGQTVTATLNYTAQGNGGDNGNGADPDPTDPEVEPGVYVSLNPFSVRDADTTITVIDYDRDEEVATSDGTDTYFDLEAGLYEITVEREGWGTVTREVEHAGGVTSVTVTLISDADAGIPGGNVVPGSVEFSYVDVNGYAFATRQEINPEKDVDLLVAQTEDRICVTVSTGVPNAIVDIDVTNTLLDTVAIVSDKCADEVELSAAAASRSFRADGNGDVQFSVFATNAWPFLDFFADDAGFTREPVKIVVSARGADGRADISEFKVFFLNMSHLYMGSGETVQSAAESVVDAVFEFLEDPSEPMDDSVHTGQRWGRVFEADVNIWDSTPTNAHYFVTGAAQKQPFNLPLASEMYGPYGAAVHFGFGGRVEYTLVGGDTDLVEWVEGTTTLDDEDFGTCSVITDSGATCVVEDSFDFAAELQPIAQATLEDLPISVDVEVTYVHYVNYGPHSYEFPLKQYTVSKQWVGGYLEVEKYVDQHVLTWYGHISADGEDNTLPQFIPLNASAPYGTAPYTSTVHIVVTNPSDSALYNVSVADILPAELGVVVDSISHGGTYESTNHRITWNYNQVEELLALPPMADDPDQPLVFTFEVYARQKPGFVRDSDAVRGQLDFSQDVEIAYADPYSIVNGLNGTVLANAFFGDTADSPQGTFYYSVQNDESTIAVVRPLFGISKTLAEGLAYVTQNNTVIFDVDIENVDRVDQESAYAALAARYPWEFGGNDTTAGSGHHADSSVTRNNPYAHSVDVFDVFIGQDGLDFTNATGFVGVVGGGNPPVTSLVDQDFRWATIGNLPAATTASALVSFNALLPTFRWGDDGEPVALTDADVDYELPVDNMVPLPGFDGEVPAWQNCVYLGAPQLNQPAGDGVTWTVEEDTPDITGVELPGTAIRDCASIPVAAAAPVTAFLTLSQPAEYINWTPAVQGALHDSRITLQDGNPVGTDFHYIFTAQNSGSAVAMNIAVDVTLTPDPVPPAVAFRAGTAYIYTASSNLANAGDWTQVGAISVTAGAAIDLDPFTFNLQPGHYARIVVPAETIASGEIVFEAEVDYDNGPGSQTLPLTVQDTTSVP